MHAPPDARPTGARSAVDWLAEKLARVTSSGELIPEIDGLRFIAIAGVICFHTMSVYLPSSGRSGVLDTPDAWRTAAALSWLVLPAYCGHFGVHLFFVISGFILALPFARRAFAGLRPPDLKTYYLRRVTRIEPPYVLSLFLCFVLGAHQTGDAVGLLPHLLASLLYGHGLAYGESSLINGVIWSLEIEIQFYLLVPLLVGVFRIRSTVLRRALLVGVILGLALLSQYYVDTLAFPRLRHTLINFLHYFLAGFLLADCYLIGNARGDPRGDHRLVAWDAVTVLSAASLAAVLTRWPEAFFLAPLLVLSLYAGFFLGRVSNALITYRWTVIIGGMCYTLYLYHAVIITWLSKRTITVSSLDRPLALDLLLQCLLIYPVIFVVCSLLFVFVEKPFMRWGRSYRR